jgi:hypothetical protein
MTVIVDDLTKRALDALDAEKKATEDENAKRREQDRQRNTGYLKDFVKRYLKMDIEPDSPSIEIDGLTFSIEKFKDYSYTGTSTKSPGLALWRKCPDCGEMVMYRFKITNLSGLGKALNSPIKCECQVPEPVMVQPPVKQPLALSDAEERLILALRDVVVENSYHE